MTQTTPPTAAPAKTLIASTTAQGGAVAILGAAIVAWPIVAKLIHRQPLTGDEIANGLAAFGVLSGAAVAIWGRCKATLRIGGIVKVRT